MRFTNSPAKLGRVNNYPIAATEAIFSHDKAQRAQCTQRT